ncbi:hypothetical protein LINPERHAP2_LOCUS9214 [Linum perenne]
MAEADGSGIVDLTTIEDSVYYLDPDEIIFHRSIVPIKFDGKNYFIWNIAMSTALKLRRKMGFVDGSIKEPANTDPNYKAWKRCNATVSLWLINSLAQPILEKMHLTGNAAELWKYLKSIYAIPYPGRMFYLQKQMFNFRQGMRSRRKTRRRYYCSVGTASKTTTSLRTVESSSSRIRGVPITD